MTFKKEVAEALVGAINANNGDARFAQTWAEVAIEKVFDWLEPLAENHNHLTPVDFLVVAKEDALG